MRDIKTIRIGSVQIEANFFRYKDLWLLNLIPMYESQDINDHHDYERVYGRERELVVFGMRLNVKHFYNRCGCKQSKSLPSWPWIEKVLKVQDRLRGR